MASTSAKRDVLALTFHLFSRFWRHGRKVSFALENVQKQRRNRSFWQLYLSNSNKNHTFAAEITCHLRKMKREILSRMEERLQQRVVGMSEPGGRVAAHHLGTPRSEGRSAFVAVLLQMVGL